MSLRIGANCVTRRGQGVAGGLCAGLLTAGMFSSGAMGQITPFSFQPPVDYPFGFNAGPTCIEPADLNNDGLLDLVISGRNNFRKVVILPGTGPGTFGPVKTVYANSQTDWVVARDLNGDGHLDLALANRRFRPGYITTLLGEGGFSYGPYGACDSTFNDPVNWFDIGCPTMRSLVVSQPASMVAEDFNGDGLTDLVVCNNTSMHGMGVVSVMLGEGDGHFRLAQTVDVTPEIQVGNSPFYMTSGDYDGNGHIDVAIANLGSTNLHVLYNNGVGGMLPHVVPLFPDAVPIALVSMDIDNDGDLDIAASDIGPFHGRILIVLNDGAGNFGSPHIVSLAGTPWHIGVADFDGDGKLDFVTTDAFIGNVRFWKNGSTGSSFLFFTAGSMTTGGFPRYLVPLDLDGDCDVDLLVADISGHKVSVLFNTTPQIGGCVAGDVTSDGVVDGDDVEAVMMSWGRCAWCDADLDRSGSVDHADLAIVMRNISGSGATPPGTVGKESREAEQGDGARRGNKHDFDAK